MQQPAAQAAAAQGLLPLLHIALHRPALALRGAPTQQAALGRQQRLLHALQALRRARPAAAKQRVAHSQHHAAAAAARPLQLPHALRRLELAIAAGARAATGSNRLLLLLQVAPLAGRRQRVLLIPRSRHAALAGAAALTSVGASPRWRGGAGGRAWRARGAALLLVQPLLDLQARVGKRAGAARMHSARAGRQPSGGLSAPVQQATMHGRMDMSPSQQHATNIRTAGPHLVHVDG